MFESSNDRETADENDWGAHRSLRHRTRLLRPDTRGQTVQIGVVLLFATAILAMTLYQVQVIPSQNHEIEFDHNQQVQDEMTSLRSTIHSIEDTNRDRKVSITLGTTYPERTLFVNPSPPIGTLRTVGTADPAVTVTIENATGVDDDVDDFWNTNTSRVHDFSTGAVVYDPTYTRYDNAPKTVYENSVLYNRFDGANLTLTNQLLVEGNTISVVALNGTFEKTSQGTANVPVEALSASTRSIVVRSSDSDPLTLRVPTQLPNESWTSLLRGEYEENGGNITDQEYRNRSGEPNVLILRLDSGRYRLNLARIGVGKNTDRPEQRYLVGVHGDDLVVGENETARVTVEVRDRFNNPVSDVQVIAHAAGRLQNGTQFTGDDGQATFIYEAERDLDGPDQNVRVNLSMIPDANLTGGVFDPDTPENVTMQFTVENTDASGTVIGGGGGGGAYSVFWDEASSSSAALDCDAGNCTFDLSEANSTSLVIGTDPAINGTTVDFAWNNSSVGGLNPGSGVTNADGENVTTFEADSTGAIRLYTSSGGATDVLNLTVVRSLIADFVFTPHDPGTGDSVEFDASNSTAPAGATYEWDWNDDGVYEDTGKIRDRSFARPGLYDVTLQVSDNNGSDTDIETVRVVGLRYNGDAVAKDGPDDPFFDDQGGAELSFTNYFNQNVTITEVTVDAPGLYNPEISDEATPNGQPTRAEIYISSDINDGYVDINGGTETLPTTFDMDNDGFSHNGNPISSGNSTLKFYLYEFYDGLFQTNTDMSGETIELTIHYELEDGSQQQQTFTITVS